MKECKVLVIDDSESILEIFEYFLESEGYKVKTLPSINNITEVVESFEPNVILMDVMLQQAKDGRQICKIIKEDNRFTHIPIILMSASPFVLVDLNECSADAIIHKPFELDEVQTLISTTI